MKYQLTREQNTARPLKRLRGCYTATGTGHEAWVLATVMMTTTKCTKCNAACRYTTWSPTLREWQRLMVCEHRVIRKWRYWWSHPDCSTRSSVTSPEHWFSSFKKNWSTSYKCTDTFRLSDTVTVKWRKVPWALVPTRTTGVKDGRSASSGRDRTDGQRRPWGTTGWNAPNSLAIWRVLSHGSRFTAAIMAYRLSGVATARGRPAFPTAARVALLVRRRRWYNGGNTSASV